MPARDDVDVEVSRIAAAIGEPARARMLFCLMDGHARTGTELAIVAEVSASTASAHLSRLRKERLVKVLAQGKHRYYSLEGPAVARALEGLSVLAGAPSAGFTPSTPSRLRTARTCYDHLAGALGVGLHDRLRALGWLDEGYQVTAEGEKALGKLGVDLKSVRDGRRKFAYGCLDWSERRPHIGGALGAALLNVALARRWVRRETDGRALVLTELGRKEIAG